MESIRQLRVSTQSFVLEGVTFIGISQQFGWGLFDDLISEHLIKVLGVFTILYVGSEWHHNLFCNQHIPVQACKKRMTLDLISAIVTKSVFWIVV